MARIKSVAPSPQTTSFETPRIVGPWKNIPAGRALALPLAFAGALAILALANATANPPLLWSMLGASALMALWGGIKMAVAARRHQTFDLVVVLRKQHYLQACAQATVFAYWGWYWRQAYDYAPMVAAQLLFAYAFDMLIAWSRRREYTLGFALFPLVLSMNLFLWFRAEWFYLQFAMIAVGAAAKELIRWKQDGRSSHIFNPSSFPLAIVSLVLIVTGSTYLTWGAEIANTFELPPHIRLVIFAVGLPGQLLFGVVTMTLSAVATVVGFGLAYYAVFHTYFFVDGFIPAAVFLGMHLLFTDPSTSPRSELGRIFFGVLYGLGVIALYAWLEKLNIPSFYDKLLPVPLMNLAVLAIEAAARSPLLRRFDPARIGQALTARRRNLAYIAIYALVFLAQSDPLGAYRPRRWVPFWQEACSENRRGGCETLGKIETKYCTDGSGWACNELAILLSERKVTSQYNSQGAFERACTLGLQAGCANARPGSLAALAVPVGKSEFRHSPPLRAEYAILLQEGNGPVTASTPAELFDRACVQGWAAGCHELGGVYFRETTRPDRGTRVFAALDRACTLGLANACADLGVMLQEGDGMPRDPARGSAYLQRACDEGFQRACDRFRGSAPPASTGPQGAPTPP